MGPRGEAGSSGRGLVPRDRELGLKLSVRSRRLGFACGCAVELGVDGSTAAGGPEGELGPVLADATPRRAHNGIRSHDDEMPPPSGPDPRDVLFVGPPGGLLMATALTERESDTKPFSRGSRVGALCSPSRGAGRAQNAA